MLCVIFYCICYIYDNCTHHYSNWLLSSCTMRQNATSDCFVGNRLHHNPNIFFFYRFTTYTDIRQCDTFCPFYLQPQRLYDLWTVFFLKKNHLSLINYHIQHKKALPNPDIWVTVRHDLWGNLVFLFLFLFFY